MRWRAICSIYGRLAKGLERLGHEVSFLVNPEALDENALRRFDALTGDHATLRAVIERRRPAVAFVWGGRIEPDRETVAILREYGIRPIFSELGWFPQNGTIYFDENGTNSEIGAHIPADTSFWKDIRFRLKRRRRCKRIYGRPVHSPSDVGVARRVFVPLQDETDTNITQDSPFSTMDEMVGYLSRHYPDCEFTIRFHPKAPPTGVDSYPNVVVQASETNLYQALSEFDAVAGINSTVLSEAALLGHPVFCFGGGIAARFGLAKVLERDTPPKHLITAPETSERRAALAFLMLDKQLDQKRLTSPRYLRQSYLDDLLAL